MAHKSSKSSFKVHSNQIRVAPTISPDLYFSVKCKVMEDLKNNGIDVAAAKKEYDKGYEKGRDDSEKFTTRTMLAAMCIALSDLYGFGKKRIIRLTDKMNEIMVEEFVTQEIIDKAFEESGVSISNDAFHLLE